MTWRRTGVVAGTAALLVLLATNGLVAELRVVALAGVTGLLVVGQRFKEPGTTALGLLGLVTAVATGPAAGAAAPGLLTWAVPTWLVVLSAAAGLGPRWPHARDTRARLGVHTAAVASCVVAAPLAWVATGTARQGTVSAGWAVGGLAAVGAALALAALAVAARDRS